MADVQYPYGPSHLINFVENAIDMSLVAEMETTDFALGFFGLAGEWASLR